MLVKCSIVILVTQYTVHLLEQSSNKYRPDSWVNWIFPDDVLIGRILQIILVNSCYIWRLYRADDWQWHDWFSENSEW